MPVTSPEVTVPVLVDDEFKSGVADSVNNYQSALDTKFDDANANLPSYETPDESKLDVIKDASTYQDPTKTVAGQLSALLAGDSDYMQAIQTNADEQAQRFGALGSTMHQGAATRQAIEGGLEIARPDAEIAAKYGLQKQAAENELYGMQGEAEISSNLLKQRSAIERQNQALDYSYNLNLKGLDLETQAAVADIQGRWTMITNDASARLEASLQEQLTSQQIDSELLAQTRDSAASMLKNYQVSTEELLKDPDFLQLGAETVKQTLNNMLRTTTASIQFVADSAGINLDAYLDDLTIGAEFTTDVNTEG